MEVTATKVVVLLLLGTIKLVFGLAPLVLARVFKKRGNGYWVKKFIGEFLLSKIRTVLCGQAGWVTGLMLH